MDANFADQLGVKGKLYTKGGHGVAVEIGGQRYSARYLKDMLEAMYKLGAEKVELYTEKKIEKFARPMVLKAKSERGELIGALMPLRNGNEHDTRIDLKASQPRFSVGGLYTGSAADVDGQMRFARAIVGGKRFILLNNADKGQKVDWNDKNALKRYLTEQIGLGAISLSDSKRITIGRELPKEYTRSTYAEKNFRNKRLRKLRAKTAQQLDELIIESGLPNAEPARDKPRENGVYYKRKVSFGVMGHEVVRGYSGELLTYTENGDELLYDLVKIKEDPSLTDALKRDGHGGLKILSANHEESADSISYSGAKSQAENEKTFRPSSPVRWTGSAEWMSRNAEDRLAQGWTFNPKGLTNEELWALAAVVPERHHTSMQGGSRAERNDTILEAMYPPNYADTYWPQFVKQFGGNKDALARIRKALYLIYGGDTNNKARWSKLDAPQFENIPKVDKDAADKRNAELYKQEQEVYKARQARKHELGYPAHKNDPEWQRLDAEYNRIRAERLAPSAEQIAADNAIAKQRAAHEATQDERFEQYRAERIAQGEAELARVAQEYGVEYKPEDRTQIRFARAIVGGKEIGVATGHRLTVAESKDEAKVREVLGEVIGKEFEQLGETKLVKVSPAFVNEFWGSTYSQKLRSRYDKLWRAKVSSVPILKDILGTTALGPKEAAKHLNKQFKNDVQFYRCNTKFGVLRHDGVAVYPCELLVMESKTSGERFVYDIVKIQKPTLTANGDLDEETLRQLKGWTHTGESATDDGSISYSGAKSQAENEKTFRLSRPVRVIKAPEGMGEREPGILASMGSVNCIFEKSFLSLWLGCKWSR
jgi:hypothetical protein